MQSNPQYEVIQYRYHMRMRMILELRRSKQRNASGFRPAPKSHIKWAGKTFLRPTFNPWTRKRGKRIARRVLLSGI
jgi:hypothetical protein